MDAKLWLWPEVTVAYNGGHPARVLRDLVEIVTNRRREIEGAWHGFFGESDEGSF